MIAAYLTNIDTLIANAFKGQDNKPVTIPNLPKDLSVESDVPSNTFDWQSLLGIASSVALGDPTLNGISGSPSDLSGGNSFSPATLPTGLDGPGTSLLPSGAATITGNPFTDFFGNLEKLQGITGNPFGAAGSTGTPNVDSEVDSSMNGMLLGATATYQPPDYSWIILLVLLFLLIISITALILPENTSQTLVNIGKLAALA